jgi:hypothetical protein
MLRRAGEAIARGDGDKMLAELRAVMESASEDVGTLAVRARDAARRRLGARCGG